MKKLFILTGFLTLLLVATPVFAKPDKAKGPVDKATGHVCGASGGWCIEFNAHEPKTEGEDAKGYIYHWSDEKNRELYLEVFYADFDGMEGEFKATCIYDSWGMNEDKVMHVEVWDYGEPGIDTDEFRWRWDDDSFKWGPVKATKGNLQVHTYE